MNIGLYDRATFTFAFDEDYGAVWILSCGDTSCSRVYVSGSSPDGALSYTAEINCTTQGFDCTPEASVRVECVPRRAGAPFTTKNVGRLLQKQPAKDVIETT